MTGHNGALGLLIGAAVGTFFLAPAHGSAQDSRPHPCAGVSYESPLVELTRCAEQGFGSAQYFLGAVYGNGYGVPKDLGETLRWFRLAAEQGLYGAQFNPGQMYETGDGVPEDDVEAVHWFRLAGRRQLAAPHRAHLTARSQAWISGRKKDATS